MALLSSFRLAVAVAALLVVGSCATEVTFKVGEGSSGKSLELVTNIAISEVEIKEKGGKDWVALKESSTNTWSLKTCLSDFDLAIPSSPDTPTATTAAMEGAVLCAANHAPLTPITFLDRAALVYPDRPAIVASSSGLTRT
ncbi:Os06g0662900 [Oryza sativa Japonica Group]|uniref:Os06g0662900 protein n=1 Tax=Oryza sativa subsp. japonica TaxID=39947 RepID=Q0DAC2_ORYSJ|nr:Os06g0662900 [Oryza sativa Japonica Group]|eukprot:NP_001058287.2 Os06g0662900 [Oryza sativa Japonica Group]